MKLFSFSAILLAAACVAQQTTATGICYDPAHVDTPTEDTVTADFQLIKQSGFNLVRTYYTAFDSTDFATLAIAQGLNVSLGISFDNDSPSDSEADIVAAIAAAQTSNGDARVVQIFVGNENLASVDTVPSEMLTYIERIKAAVPSDVLVGTVQRNTELLDSSRNTAISGLADLFAACDIVGVNIQPVFTSNTEASAAIDLVSAQWTELKGTDIDALFTGIADKLALTETGWPTDGTSDGNTGSLTGAQTFFSDYNTWRAKNLADDRGYYFQMFDQPSRTDTAFEPYFGLADSDGNLKFDFSLSGSGSV